jgi:hypothetical protein
MYDRGIMRLKKNLDRALIVGLIFPLLAVLQFCCIWMDFSPVGAGVPRSSQDLASPAAARRNAMKACCSRENSTSRTGTDDCHSGSRSCDCEVRTLTLPVSAQQWSGPDLEILFLSWNEAGDTSRSPLSAGTSGRPSFPLDEHPPGSVPQSGPDASRAPPQYTRESHFSA